ncbi:hypothetical protein PC128_g18346 [Phytophthora cactorum]|nr:hypothetical protein PC128_g18346 [Phytophthora cactorum]
MRVGSSVPTQTVSAPVHAKRSSVSPRVVASTTDPFLLSQLVSNAMKVQPVFYFDTATV